MCEKLSATESREADDTLRKSYRHEARGELWL